MHHCGVAVLEKGLAILYGMRLALTHLGGSKPINITLTEYYNTSEWHCVRLALNEFS